MRAYNFRVLLVVVVVIIGVLVPVGWCTNVDNLKGTYSSLPPELWELSPLEGAIAWHTGLMRRLYDLGHMTEGEPTDKPRRGDPAAVDWMRGYEKWRKEIPSPSVRFVVRALFYRVPGTTSVADFSVSQNVFRGLSKITETQAVHQVATAVAKTLASIWVHQQVTKAFGAKVPRFLKAQIKIDDFVVAAATGEAAVAGPAEAAPSAAAEETTEFRLDCSILETALKTSASSVFLDYDVVCYSLLAVLWCKCGGNRGALRVYIDTLKEAVSEKIRALEEAVAEGRAALGDVEVKTDERLQKMKAAQRTEELKQRIRGEVAGEFASYDQVMDKCKLCAKHLSASRVLDDAWEADTFAGKQAAVKETVTKMEDVADISNPVGYEQFVYVRLLPSKQPEDVPYEEATLMIGGTKTGINFLDCMEMVIRNFCNHVAFQEGDFTATAITALTKQKPHDTLADFYRTHGQVVLSGTRGVRDAWTGVVSNLPWVEYIQCRGKPERKTTVGYIKIPAEERTHELMDFLSDRGYVVVDDAAVVFELHPTCRNLIMMLDHLLNLGLFEETDKAAAFMRPDFVKVYLPKVFERMSGKMDALPVDVAIDKNEFATPAKTEFTVNLFESAGEERVPYSVTFDISIRFHGQFKSERLAGARCPLFDQSMFWNAVETLPPYVSMLFPMNLFNYLLTQGRNQQWLRLALFAQAIDNPDVTTGLVQHLYTFDQPWYRVMKFLVGRHLDKTRKQQGLLSVFTHAVYAALEDAYVDAKRMAEVGIMSPIAKIRAGAFGLWLKLLEKNKNFEGDVKHLADEAAGSEHADAQCSALLLRHILVESGSYDGDARKAAMGGIASPYVNVNAEALSLLSALVKHGQCYAEARDAALGGIASLDSGVRTGAAALWYALVSQLSPLVVQGEALAEAIKVVAAGMTSTHAEALEGTSALWHALVNKLSTLVAQGEHYPEAKKAAAIGIASPNYAIRTGAQNLWLALFKQKEGFVDARDVATGLLWATDHIQKSLRLWKILVENEQYLVEAIDAARVGTLSHDFWAWNDASSLWESLFKMKNKLAFTEAHKLLSEPLSTRVKDGLSRLLIKMRQYDPTIAPATGE